MVDTFVTLLVAAAAAQVPAQASLTPCQQCCAPGGDCSKAFKGQPGKCCGASDGGQAFCCPGALEGAKCYRCTGSYRCYTGVASATICGGTAVRSPPHRHEDPRRNEDLTPAWVSNLVWSVAIFSALYFCFRSQADVYHPEYGGMPMGKPVYGVPQPMPAAGMHPAPAYPGYGYPAYGGGYSGTAVAGSAAAGFLGGMMISQAMDAGNHHHNGGYGGDYGGGGYVSGGSDGTIGGGDDGFAADS
jgi:hypothetical protein